LAKECFWSGEVVCLVIGDPFGDAVV